MKELDVSLPFSDSLIPQPLDDVYDNPDVDVPEVVTDEE
jgi:hypothetical protein